MFITRMALDRRSFLRGVGATLALPLLDAMSPAFAACSRSTTSVLPGMSPASIIESPLTAIKNVRDGRLTRWASMASPSAGASKAMAGGPTSD